MSKETRRFMRLLLFFDLPMVTKTEKRAYVQFRRFLLNDGYDMIQWSVYGRLINGSDDHGVNALMDEALRCAQTLPHRSATGRPR